jgi:hypothetical protein
LDRDKLGILEWDELLIMREKAAVSHLASCWIVGEIEFRNGNGRKSAEAGGFIPTRVA